MKIAGEYKPYPLLAEIPYKEAKQFIVGRYRAFISQSDLSRRQKRAYTRHFRFFADHVEERLNEERTAREQKEPYANLPYHGPHMWQATHDGINVADAFLEHQLVPEELAYETPRNALTHDLEYLHALNDTFPTYAHNIRIHVPLSIGSSVKLIREEPIDFYSEEQRLMSLYGTALEIHGTHFASPDEMKFHLANRQRMIQKFATRFSNNKNYQFMKSAAEWLCVGSRIWDFWGQLCSTDYMERLPDLQLEMNAATPLGKPLKGDMMIGITPEERMKKSAGFIQVVALDQPTIEAATTLFGEHNSYEQRLRQLSILTSQAA